MNLIETVIINWKRPANIVSIIDALKHQNTTITIIDCPVESDYLPNNIKNKVDKYIVLDKNYGSYNRFIPIDQYDHKYTFFIDNDLLPGPNAIENLLYFANNNNFAVAGQFGRKIINGFYQPVDIPLSDTPTPVDFIVRAYLINTVDLPFIEKMRQKMKLRDKIFTDDMLACGSIKLATGKNNYVIPKPDNLSSIAAAELDDGNSVASTADHWYNRQSFLIRLRQEGWKEL